jgi:hypothetical protein
VTEHCLDLGCGLNQRTADLGERQQEFVVSLTSIYSRARRPCAALALLAGCSSDSTTAPDNQRNQFDAAKVSANVATIERVAATPIIDAWTHLADFLSSTARTSPTPAPPDGATQLINTIRRLASVTGADRGVFLVPVLRSGVLGSTYVYDATTQQYVADPARTGAPANGVRFVLYETDDTGAIMPATEIGYADLIDEKAASTSSAGLHFKVVSGTTTVLDYAFEVGGLFISPTIDVTGYISDGTDRVNFDLSTQAPAWESAGPFELEAKLTVPSTGFTVNASLSGTASPEPSSNVELSLQSGTDKLEVSAATEQGQIDASVKVNGAVFATVEGPASNPTIKGEGGRDLTQEEWAALAKVVEFTDGVFALLGGLFAPAGVLLAIALGLHP